MSGTAAEPGASSPKIVERVDGRHGELALRRAGGHYEVISNGVFLMDTRGGRSERELVRRAAAMAPGARTALLGGLGAGFSLAQCLALGLDRIVVVECEEAVIRWNRQFTGAVTGGSAHAPGVRVILADLVDWLESDEQRFDRLCLDIDNGPDWVVAEANRRLYSADGLAAVSRRMHAESVAAFWSSADSPPFERRLRTIFGDVTRAEEPADRGAPDVLYFARRPLRR